MPETPIAWYRRDLRVHDPAPVFVLHERLLHGRFDSGPGARFLLGCLRELRAALRDRGADLAVRTARRRRAALEQAGVKGCPATCPTRSRPTSPRAARACTPGCATASRATPTSTTPSRDELEWRGWIHDRAADRRLVPDGGGGITGAQGQLKVATWKIRIGKAPAMTYRCAAPGGKLGACG